MGDTSILRTPKARGIRAVHMEGREAVSHQIGKWHYGEVKLNCPQKVGPKMTHTFRNVQSATGVREA